eukprot:gene996-biopygen8155
MELSERSSIFSASRRMYGSKESNWFSRSGRALRWPTTPGGRLWKTSPPSPPPHQPDLRPCIRGRGADLPEKCLRCPAGDLQSGPVMMKARMQNSTPCMRTFYAAGVYDYRPCYVPDKISGLFTYKIMCHRPRARCLAPRKLAPPAQSWCRCRCRRCRQSHFVAIGPPRAAHLHTVAFAFADPTAFARLPPCAGPLHFLVTCISAMNIGSHNESEADERSVRHKTWASAVMDFDEQIRNGLRPQQPRTSAALPQHSPRVVPPQVINTCDTDHHDDAC